MNARNNRKNTMKRMIRVGTVVATMLLTAMSVSAAGGGLMDSKLYTGAVDFIKDATTIATIVCPLIGGCCAIYFAGRRAIADEQDGKLWQKRIVTAISWGIGGTLISGFMAIITNYFA